MATCIECGKGFAPRSYDSQFCQRSCRLQFNNRRQARGVELYDAQMALSVEPDPQVREAIREHIKRLIAAYKTSDTNKRSGRKSWLPWAHTRTRRPGGYGVEGDGR